MGRLVKCAHCGEQFDKDNGKRYKNKNYHKKCYDIVVERDELVACICKIFHLKKAGPRNYAMIKSYLEKGYTYKGMENALKYFYEVQNHPIDKANESIGIIPYIYEEAQNYFNRIMMQQDKITKMLEEKNKDTIKVTMSNAPKKKKKQLLDLDLLEGE